MKKNHIFIEKYLVILKKSCIFAAILYVYIHSKYENNLIIYTKKQTV